MLSPWVAERLCYWLLQKINILLNHPDSSPLVPISNNYMCYGAYIHCAIMSFKHYRNLAVTANIVHYNPYLPFSWTRHCLQSARHRCRCGCRRCTWRQQLRHRDRRHRDPPPTHTPLKIHNMFNWLSLIEVRTWSTCLLRSINWTCYEYSTIQVCKMRVPIGSKVSTRVKLTAMILIWKTMWL